MSHRNARLTVHGRRLLVHRVRELGMPIAHVARAMGVSRQCAHRWVNRFDDDGDGANAADYYLRRLVHSLEKTYDPDSSGESALTRLTGRMVAEAAGLGRAAAGARNGVRWSRATWDCC